MDNLNQTNRPIGQPAELSGLTLGMELCASLTETVGRNGFHGGVRPENITMDPQTRQPKLGAPMEHEAGRFTQQELEFMAPELFWSGNRAPAADVYGVGLTLYALYNRGRLPFWPEEGEVTQADRAEALQRRMRGEAITPPTDAPEELGQIILRALAFREEERWYDPEELRAALGDCSAPSEGDKAGVQETFLALAGSSAERAKEETIEMERVKEEIVSAQTAEKEPLANGEKYDLTETDERLPAEELSEAKSAENEELEIPAFVMMAEPAKPESAVSESESEKTAESAEPRAAETTISEGTSETVTDESVANEAKEEKGTADQIFAAVSADTGKETAENAEPTEKKEKKRNARPINPSSMPAVMWADCEMQSSEMPEEQKKRRVIVPLAILLLILAIVIWLLSLGRSNRPGKEDPVPIPPNAVEQTQTPLDEPEVTEAPEETERPGETEEPTPSEPPEPIETPEPVAAKADCTWEEAAALCEAQGGHLAVARTQEEMDALIAIATENNIRMLWLGAQPDENGDWYWVTGEKMDFAVWGANEPSRQDLDGTPENCLLLWRNNNGVWCFNDCRNDPLSVAYVYYAGQMGYICQFD